MIAKTACASHRQFFAPWTTCVVYTETEWSREEVQPYVSWKSAAWYFCGCHGKRHSDCRYFSDWSIIVFGGFSADCVRLRLLPALERSKTDEYRNLEIPESLAWNSTEIIQSQGISDSDGS